MVVYKNCPAIFKESPCPRSCFLEALSVPVKGLPEGFFALSSET